MDTLAGLLLEGLGSWAIEQGEALHCSTWKALYICSLSRYCALGLGMNGEAGHRGFRAAAVGAGVGGVNLLAVILAEACSSKRTVQNGQARAGFPTPPHIS